MHGYLSSTPSWQHTFPFIVLFFVNRLRRYSSAALNRLWPLFLSLPYHTSNHYINLFFWSCWNGLPKHTSIPVDFNQTISGRKSNNSSLSVKWPSGFIMIIVEVNGFRPATIQPRSVTSYTIQLKSLQRGQVSASSDCTFSTPASTGENGSRVRFASCCWDGLHSSSSSW